MEETTIALESCSYKPLEKDESQGMPTFKVNGRIGDTSFEGEISIELDGRDMSWEGSPPEEEACDLADGEFFTLLACAVNDHPSWKDAREEHADYWNE